MHPFHFGRATAFSIPPSSAGRNRRHRVEAAADVVGQENPDERRKRKPVSPFPLSNDEPDGVGHPDHPDEVLGADVGRDDRAADGVPGQSFAGQKIAARSRSPAPRHQSPKAILQTR